ncbi:MAG: multicopper oxidase domain-containing protein, partial [Silvibacterium sp.]
PRSLRPWVDPLPIPEIARSTGSRSDPENPSQNLPFYRMAMRELHYKVHRDLPPTRVWGFNNSSPGPIFETRSGQGLLVEWANELPLQHFLPIDHTIHGAESDKPDVRSVIHLHGGKTPPASDGYPEDWYIPGQSRIYHYPNRQDAALLFYHDHTMGINRLNIYAGLQGQFMIRDDVEDSLNLPKGKYEIPLLLYDRFLLADGQLQYPVSPDPKAPWVPEVYSNAMLVNGMLTPYLDVEPRSYRFRVMNGSNSRFFRISIGHKAGQGPDLHIIGSDQGLLAAPITQQKILLAPAERTDFLIDFSPFAGQNLLLLSDSLEILQIRVAANNKATALALPQTLRPVPRTPETQAIQTRRLTLDEIMDKVQQSMGMLLNKTPWHMPITEKPVLDTTEIWELVNLTEDTHPIHLHLVRFQLLDRRPFDVFLYQDKNELRYTGPALPPEPVEAGWKDTVRAESGEVTRIIVKFEGYTGRYVWHCHILEHEDNEMMRPYEVVAAT